MELKKNPKADLNRIKGLLLEIGLIISLLVIIFAFSYTPKEHRIEQVDVNYGPVEEQITEITRQEEKTPPPPKKVEVKVITDLLQVVTNDTKVDVEVDFAEFDEEVEIVQQVAAVEEVIEEDEVFLFAETQPTFEGGDMNSFRAWVQKRLVYPQIAQENGIQGTVFVEFIIRKDGTVGDVRAVRSPDRMLSEEAIRIIQSSPKWTPAKQRDNVISLKVTIPIVFKMQS